METIGILLNNISNATEVREKWQVDGHEMFWSEIELGFGFEGSKRQFVGTVRLKPNKEASCGHPQTQPI